MAKKSNAVAKKAAKQPKKSAPKPIAKAPKPPTPIVPAVLKHREGPKWSLSKLEMKQYLSMTSYMTVVNIPGKGMISVKNQYGNHMQMSKSLLETMYSSSHYSETVNLNMTGLAELLQSV